MGPPLRDHGWGLGDSLRDSPQVMPVLQGQINGVRERPVTDDQKDADTAVGTSCGWRPSLRHRPILDRCLVNTHPEVAAQREWPAGGVTPHLERIVVGAEENEETRMRPDGLSDPHQTNGARRAALWGKGHRRDAASVDARLGYG